MLRWVAVFGLVLASAKATITSDYYDILITEGAIAAEIYSLPETNEEFQDADSLPEVQDYGSFDFIIIGAGTAGSVLATRLSEISDLNILVLEAGGEEDDYSTIPYMWLQTHFSEKNWGYYSTQQITCCLGMQDQKCMIPRGKVVGGSAAIGAGMYVRGNSKDFDRWAELGNTDWSYEQVLPYFIKSENSEVDSDEGYHGKGGLWNVEYGLPALESFNSFIDGCKELNQTMLDYNGEDQVGASQMQWTMKRGKKQSAGAAFLDGARKRRNLIVQTKALVTKIEIDPESLTATGVEFITPDQKYHAIATKEVIVSGGAINSPQLLMLSGVGPADHLGEIGIPVVANLPVGKTLYDTPMFPGLIFHSNYTFPYSIAEVTEQYLTGYGAFTKAASIEGIGFLLTENSTLDVPTVEYLFITPSSNPVPILQRAFNFNDDLIFNFLAHVTPLNDIMIFLGLLHPQSKGQVTLKSNNPIDFPNVDLNMFSSQEDVDTLTEGIEFALRLAETDAFQKMDAQQIEIPLCTVFETGSKLYWDCVIRQMATTNYHPSGTTPMGTDPTSSVVGSNLKVHGIEHLRVVDAGVFPTTISGHPNAVTVMVAEKISDVIKADYGYI